LHRCTLVSADEYLFGFLLLTSTLYFQLGSSSGLDVIKYPTCSNTCPLPRKLNYKTSNSITFNWSPSVISEKLSPKIITAQKKATPQRNLLYLHFSAVKKIA